MSVLKGLDCGCFKMREYLPQSTSKKTSERPVHIFPFHLILEKLPLPTNLFIFMDFEEKITF